MVSTVVAGVAVPADIVAWVGCRVFAPEWAAEQRVERGIGLLELHEAELVLELDVKLQEAVPFDPDHFGLALVIRSPGWTEVVLM